MTVNNVTQYFVNIMNDDKGSPSSKRWVVFICLLVLIVSYIANLFWKYTVEEYMFNGFTYIVIGGMGFTGVEKFAPSIGDQLTRKQGGDDDSGK